MQSVVQGVMAMTITGEVLGVNPPSEPPVFSAVKNTSPVSIRKINLEDIRGYSEVLSTETIVMTHHHWIAHYKNRREYVKRLVLVGNYSASSYLSLRYYKSLADVMQDKKLGNTMVVITSSGMFEEFVANSPAGTRLVVFELHLNIGEDQSTRRILQGFQIESEELPVIQNLGSKYAQVTIVKKTYNLV